MAKKVSAPKHGWNVLLVLITIISIFFAAVFVLYQYLPSTLSSTTPILDINGPAVQNHLHDPNLVLSALSESMPAAHSISHTLPTHQVSVRYETRPHPAVKALPFGQSASSAMSAKFRSLVPGKIKIWYDDHRGGVESGHLTQGQETTTNTYNGHVFFFTDFNDKSKVYARYTMKADQVFYVIEDPARPAPRELKKRTDDELKFIEEYKAKHGLAWRHYYGANGPRPPPKLFMWPATTVGEVHAVTSNQGHWECKGPVSECQSVHPVHLELEVISLTPRAFIVSNFLSSFEADAIVALAKPQLHHSSVGDTETGAFQSDTRTSSNAWVQRHASSVTETLFRRAADLLQVDEKVLERSYGAEDMQVVHYVNGQKYDAHHDWGVSGYPESRLITLLLYLTDMPSPTAGGETAFPKGGADGKGFKIHPGKGNAVLFYNLLEDGNGDDLALHAALPALQGEKWLANFWVWDPRINK